MTTIRLIPELCHALAMTIVRADWDASERGDMGTAAKWEDDGAAYDAACEDAIESIDSAAGSIDGPALADALAAMSQLEGDWGDDPQTAMVRRAVIAALGWEPGRRNLGDMLRSGEVSSRRRHPRRLLRPAHPLMRHAPQVGPPPWGSTSKNRARSPEATMHDFRAILGGLHHLMREADRTAQSVLDHDTQHRRDDPWTQDSGARKALTDAARAAREEFDAAWRESVAAVGAAT